MPILRQVPKLVHPVTAQHSMVMKTVPRVVMHPTVLHAKLTMCWPQVSVHKTPRVTARDSGAQAMKLVNRIVLGIIKKKLDVVLPLDWWVRVDVLIKI